MLIWQKQNILLEFAFLLLHIFPFGISSYDGAGWPRSAKLNDLEANSMQDGQSFRDYLQKLSLFDVEDALVDLSAKSFSMNYLEVIIHLTERSSSFSPTVKDASWVVIQSAHTNLKNVSDKSQLGKKLLNAVGSLVPLLESNAEKRCADLRIHSILRTYFSSSPSTFHTKNISSWFQLSSKHSNLGIYSDAIDTISKSNYADFYLLKVEYNFDTEMKSGQTGRMLSFALFSPQTPPGTNQLTNNLDFTVNVDTAPSIKLRVFDSAEPTCDGYLLGCVYTKEASIGMKRHPLLEDHYLKIVVENYKLIILQLNLTLAFPSGASIAQHHFLHKENVFDWTIDSTFLHQVTEYRLEIRALIETTDTTHIQLAIYWLTCFHFVDSTKTFTSQGCSTNGSVELKTALCNCSDLPRYSPPQTCDQMTNQSILTGYHISNFSALYGLKPYHAMVSVEGGLILLLFLILYFTSYLIISVMKGMKGKVIFINQDDNYPNDFYRYYVTVDTGGRGGCEASVAIKLFGKENSSNVHIIQDVLKDHVLKSSRLVSYLITTSECLGDIERVRIWRGPDVHGDNIWSFRAITVMDLERNDCWISLIASDFGLRMDNVVKMGRMHDLMNVERVIRSHFYKVLEERLIFLLPVGFSPYIRFMRVSQVERLVIIFLVIIMLSVNAFAIEAYFMKGRREDLVGLWNIGFISACLTHLASNILFEILHGSRKRDDGGGDESPPNKLPFILKFEHPYQKRLAAIVITRHMEERLKIPPSRLSRFLSEHTDFQQSQNKSFFHPFFNCIRKVRRRKTTTVAPEDSTTDTWGGSELDEKEDLTVKRFKKFQQSDSCSGVRISRSDSHRSLHDEDYLAMIRLYSKLQCHQQTTGNDKSRLFESYDALEIQEASSPYLGRFPHYFRMVAAFIIFASTFFCCVAFLIFTGGKPDDERFWNNALYSAIALGFYLLVLEPVKIVATTLISILINPLVDVKNYLPPKPSKVKPMWHWNARLELDRQVKRRLLHKIYLPPVVYDVMY